MDAMPSSRFDEVPEWSDEQRELFPVPASFEASEPTTPETEYHLAHVLDDGSWFDPDFLDSLNG